MRIKHLLPFVSKPARIAVIRLHGQIGAARPGASGLSDASLAPLLERAFRRGRPAAVALAVNSPGGSPVQSSLIAARIRRLSEETETPVHAFIEDVAASGGYWLACAADEIWADSTSVIGSIGVISAGFGFAGLIDRYGIERRVHTAGGAKSFLDPFRPEKPEDVERLRNLLEPMHATFRAHVMARRGAKLVTDRDLFTGDVWTGEQATDLGLIDGVAHMVPKLRERYGKDALFLNYGLKRPLFRRFGLEAAGAVLDAAEERALWARYGL
jgi:serine protease SohB